MLEILTEFARRKKDPEDLPAGLRVFVPLWDWNLPAWSCFEAVASLRGDTGEVRISDFEAHLRLIGVASGRARARCYRLARAVFAEWLEIRRGKEPQATPDGKESGQ